MLGNWQVTSYQEARCQRKVELGNIELAGNQFQLRGIYSFNTIYLVSDAAWRGIRQRMLSSPELYAKHLFR
jgi:hypothetical protein